MILDSTFLHDLIRKDAAAINRLAELSETGTRVALSTLTVFEVGVGLHGESTQHRERFEKHTSKLVVLPLSEDDARRAIDIQHTLLARGERIGARDVLIAGTAVGSADPRVLTRNTGKFNRVDGLTVETY